MTSFILSLMSNIQRGLDSTFTKLLSTFYGQCARILIRSESESELFTGDTSKDNHSPGPVFREVSP